MDKKVLQREIEKTTKSEIELVQFFANDYRPLDVAETLGLSIRTIEQYIFRLRSRFDCQTVGGLIGIFYRQKLIK